jgi:hypothetical protein
VFSPLLTDEAWLTMPPEPHKYQGRAAIGLFLDDRTVHRGALLRLVPTWANDQPAFGCYLPSPQTGYGGKVKSHPPEALALASGAGTCFVAGPGATPPLPLPITSGPKETSDPRPESGRHGRRFKVGGDG